MNGPFLRFLLVGAANTAVGLACILMFQFGAGLSPLAANACGYLVGIVLSYALNRHFTFRSSVAHRVGVPAFVSVAALSYGINAAVLEVALALPNMPSAVAQACAICAYTLSFYAMSRTFVFGRTGR